MKSSLDKVGKLVTLSMFSLYQLHTSKMFKNISSLFERLYFTCDINRQYFILKLFFESETSELTFLGSYFPKNVKRFSLFKEARYRMSLAFRFHGLALHAIQLHRYMWLTDECLRVS